MECGMPAQARTSSPQSWVYLRADAPKMEVQFPIFPTLCRNFLPSCQCLRSEAKALIVVVSLESRWTKQLSLIFGMIFFHLHIFDSLIKAPAVHGLIQ